MDLLLCIQLRSESNRAVLNSLLLNLRAVLNGLHHNISVQVSETLTEWRASAVILVLVLYSLLSFVNSAI